MPPSAYPSLVSAALKARKPGYEAMAQRYGRYASTPAGSARIQSAMSQFGQAAPPHTMAAPAPSPPQAPPAAPAASSGADRIFNALEGVDPNDTWVSQNRAAITGQMLPAALKAFPGQNEDRIARALEGSDWRRQYFYNIAHEGFGGAPVYNRHDAGDSAGLVFVPGFRPGGAAAALSGTNQGDYGRYDPAGRFLGNRSGFINGAWVY